MDQPASLFVLGSFVVACSAKVAHLPRPGESLRAEAFTAEPGGKGLNLALGAHRLGARIDGIFSIGTDLFAQLAYSAFAQAGLSPSMLRQAEAKTGSGIGFTDSHGENCLAVCPGANLLLSAPDIRSIEKAVREAHLVLAQFEIGDEPILEAFALAQDAGVRTLLNPSPFRCVNQRMLEHTSVLVLNRVEATQLAESSGFGAHGTLESLNDMATTLLERGPELIVVTLGNEGAIAYQKGARPLRQPAFQVNVVDTLGAGDAFTAGLAVGLLQGRPLPECLRQAAACGAIVCMEVGVFDVLPNAQQLDVFLVAQETKQTR
ncbi:ribokinase [Microvirga arabica]|uniref:Ribokinase n=1 Tax=Microvirga arabica TaxID=1128671 RepID=A0ABV6Y9W1_9HYPH